MLSTTFDFFYKIIPLILGAVAAWHAAKQLLLGTKTGLRDEYKLAKSFFDELKDQPSMREYAKHKGFQAIAGDPRMPAAEIEYLLSMYDPTRVMMDYVFSRDLLQFNPGSGPQLISFKGKYITPSYRKNIIRFNFVAFCLTYFFAVSPILMLSLQLISAGLAAQLLVVTLPSLWLTFLSVRLVVKIRRAKLLIDSQPTIFLAPSHKF